MPSPRASRLLSTLALAAIAAAALLVSVPAAEAAPASQANTGVNMADPGYLKTPGFRSGGGAATSYFMIYGTGDKGGFPVRYRTGGYKGTYKTSSRPYALAASALPGWVGTAPTYGQRLWAPTVFVSYSGEDRYSYVMYFSAWHKNRKQSCIGTAVSSSPFGPFVPKGGPYCPPAGASVSGDSRKPEAIDPTAYRDSAGRNYLLYKTSVANEKNWSTWALRMDASGAYKEKGATVKLVKRFDARAENPTVIRHGSTFWMFVSEGVFDTCDYSTRAFKASSLAGPWTRSSTALLSKSSTGLCGPGGMSLAADGSTYRMAYHAWKDAANPGKGARRTWVATLGWTSSGNPVVK